MTCVCPSSAPLLMHPIGTQMRGSARGGFALRHAIAVAAVAILGLVPCGSLTAQPVMPAYPAPYPGYYPGAYGGLPPYEVLAIVRSRGLEPLSRPRRQGPVYALRALDPADREVQVTVDARTGRILKIAPATNAGAVAPANPIPYPAEGMDGEVRNPALTGASRSPTGLRADEAPSRPGGEAALLPLPRPRPKGAHAPSLSASAADPVPAVTDQAPPAVELEE
jgi:hypothetical protein